MSECSVCSHYDSFSDGGRRKKKKQPKVASIESACESSQVVLSEASATSEMETCSQAAISIQSNVSNLEMPIFQDNSETDATSAEPITFTESSITETGFEFESEEQNVRQLMDLARAIAGELPLEEHVTSEPYCSESKQRFPYPLPVATSTPRKRTETHSSIPSTPRKVVTSISTQTVTPEEFKRKVVSEHTTSPMIKLSDHSVKSKIPLSKEEEKFATGLVRRKLVSSDDGETLQYKTGGRDMTFVRVELPTKDSDKASSRTKRRRSKLMKRMRNMLSGRSSVASDAQHIHELKSLPSEKRKKLLERSGFRSQRQKMSPKLALAMKESVGLTYHQQKTQSKFLRQIGVVIPNEHHIRSMSKELSKGDVKVENKEFEDGIGGPITVATCQVDSVVNYAKTLLDRYEEEGKLTWHDGAIPEGEVWIKVGGDHGKGSFKIALQVCNVQAPNSKRNTHMVYMAKVKDTVRNLEEIFRHIGIQCEALDGMMWKDKMIKVFVFGDYDFVCKVYGLSGAQGRHPCLFCHTSKSTMQDHGVEHQSRTLQSLQHDLESFLSDGGDKKKASLFNNVVRKPMLNINIDRIAPPYLHILLGLVHRHHTHLEAETQELDYELSREKAESENEAFLFMIFRTNWENAKTLEEQGDFWRGCMLFSDDRSEIRKYRRKAEECDAQIDDLEEKEPAIGPVRKALDKCLDRYGIVRQAFHGGSFIGNHCKKYLTYEVRNGLANAILETTKRLTTTETIIDRAEEIANKFQEINAAFATVHTLLSHARATDEDEITAGEKAIQNYMNVYRRHFPGRITPKHHILEHHCIPWMRKYKFGMGLHGEQGGEQLHSTVARIEHRSRGIRNSLDQARHVMESLIVQTAPSVHSMLPLPKTC